MNLLSFLTLTSIYHGCSTRKTFREEKFTLGEFTPVNMKNGGQQNVKKHIEIKNGEKYTTLDILLKFGRLEKIKITSSDPKYYLGRPGKGLINSLGFKTIVRSNKDKKARYAITNASIKDILNMIKDFERLPYKGYESNRPKHELTNSYFYLVRQLAKCMTRDDDLNLNVEPVRTEMTDTQQIPISHICDLDESESKGTITEMFYCKSVLRTRANQKALSFMKVLQMRANQKDFKKYQQT